MKKIFGTSVNSGREHKKIASFLEVKDNKELWSKRDSTITVLNFFEKPFACERCGEETNMTSQSTNMGFGMHHPVCCKCYPELHAYHISIEKDIWRIT